MSKTMAWLESLKLSSYPHFSKMPKPTGWITPGSKLNDRREFAQKQRTRFRKISIIVCVLFLVSLAGMVRGLPRYFDASAAPSILEINITFICCVVFIPLAFLMLYFSEVAAQHDKWLRDNPMPKLKKASTMS